MRFASGINRPPYETADGYLQSTEGCSHNHCLFCTYFKDSIFRKSTIEEIEADIKQIPISRPHSVWCCDRKPCESAYRSCRICSFVFLLF